MLPKREFEMVINHWTRLSECQSVSDFLAEGWYGENCAFCNNRRWAGSVHCLAEGCPCPIAKDGFSNCMGTPYDDASDAIQEYINDPCNETLEDAHREVTSELEYLKDLKERTVGS